MREKGREEYCFWVYWATLADLRGQTSRIVGYQFQLSICFLFCCLLQRDHPCKSVVVLLAHIKTTVQVFHLISGVLVYSNSLEIDCLCVTLLECCDSGVEGPRFPTLCM